MELKIESNLILSQGALNKILTYGDQVSSYDFNGWIYPKQTVYRDRYYNYFINLSFDGTIILIALLKPKYRNKNKVFKPITQKKWASILYSLQQRGILTDIKYEPFTEFLQQSNLKMDAQDTEFLEETIFNIGQDQYIPMIKSNKMIKTPVIKCSECGELISFSIEEAKENMKKYNINNIILKCPWCKSKLTLNSDHFKNCKFIYKEESKKHK